jgi:hypothetical protein
MRNGDDADDEFAAKIDPESAARMVFMSDDYYFGWALRAIGAAAAGEPQPARTMPHPPKEWVYFVQQGAGGPIKIGYSKDPVGRFVSLQTGSAVKHRYLGNMPGTRATERELHGRFHGSRVRGEWYEPTPELLAFIEEHRFRPDSTWSPRDEVVELW